MDAVLTKTQFRDPRYAARRLEMAQARDGSLILFNPTPYVREHLTAASGLDHWAEAAPSRTWLAERSGAGWRELSYAEAQATVAVLAGALQGLGLGPDKPLAILARNSIDHALIAYAALRIGCPIAPLSPQYAGAKAEPSRLAHAAALVRPGAVYVEDAEAAHIALERDPVLRRLPLIAAKVGKTSALSLESLLGAPAVGDLARPDMTAKLLLTSGSTGKPKAVIGTHANLAANSAQIAACYDDPEPPVVVNAAPWSHSLGANAILHMVLHRGGTLYIDHGQPTPERFGETLQNLSEISPTYHNMVPAGWTLFADALEKDERLARTFFSRVRVIQYGGAGLPQAVCDRVQASAVRACGEMITFAAGYGSTETGPTACNVHWLNDKAGLLGLPTPGTTVKLAPVGDKFEVRVKGPQLSPGYRSPEGELIPLPADEDGFYPLGDAARLADPSDPRQGLVFDGRLVENFKLLSGTFVAAGALRLAAVSAIGGAASDAVVCGEGEAGVGLLVFVNPDYCRKIMGLTGELADLAAHPLVRTAIEAGLAKLNASAGGGSGKVTRALIQPDAPDHVSGEVTDKGYINQALARTRRVRELKRLYAVHPDPDVIVVS